MKAGTGCQPRPHPDSAGPRLPAARGTGGGPSPRRSGGVRPPWSRKSPRRPTKGWGWQRSGTASEPRAALCSRVPSSRGSAGSGVACGRGVTGRRPGRVLLTPSGRRVLRLVETHSPVRVLSQRQLSSRGKTASGYFSRASSLPRPAARESRLPEPPARAPRPCRGARASVCPRGSPAGPDLAPEAEGDGAGGAGRRQVLWGDVLGRQQDDRDRETRRSGGHAGQGARGHAAGGRLSRPALPATSQLARLSPLENACETGARCGGTRAARRLQLTQAADVTPPRTPRPRPPGDRHHRSPPPPSSDRAASRGGAGARPCQPVSAAASLSAWDLSQVTESELGRRQGRRQPPRDPQGASEGGARRVGGLAPRTGLPGQDRSGPRPRRVHRPERAACPGPSAATSALQFPPNSLTSQPREGQKGKWE